MLFSLLSRSVQQLSAIERFSYKLHRIETSYRRVTILGGIVVPRLYRHFFDTGIEMLVLVVLTAVSNVSHNTSIKCSV